MNHLLYALISSILESMKPKHDARLRLLEFQIQMLRHRLDASRIVPTPADRAELLRLGELCDHDIDTLISVVCRDTYKTWIRKAYKGLRPKRSGRPRIPEAVRKLRARIAGENRGWSYRRVCGELKKLGIPIGATTVRNIKKEDGLLPPYGGNNGHPPIEWTSFIKARMDTQIACDFFTKKIYGIHGIKTAHVLVFIHPGSRKVYHSYPTYHPNGD